MRKEQHKAFQEKNKFNQKENSDLDITKVLGDTKDEKKILNKESELDEAPTNKDSNNDSSRTSLPSTHASRPLVPPGFRKSINNSLEVIILYSLLIAYASSKLLRYYINVFRNRV